MKWRSLLLVAACIAMSGCTGDSQAERREEGGEPRLAVDLTHIPQKNDSWLRNKVRIRIRNTGTGTAVLSKPLDGSLWSWHLPFYQFTVTNGDGKKLKMMGRCGVSGLSADTKWPDEYVFSLKPGENYTREFYLFHKIPKDGLYKVQFEYVMEPKLNKRKVVEYPDELWQGTLASPVKEFRLEKQSQ